MPQDGHLDPHITIEVSRPKQAHTWHFTVLFIDFLGKIRVPIFLRGDPGGVELWELAAITEPCLFLPESRGKLSVASHWCSGVISASQFKQLGFSGGPGVKTSGAGEGRLFVQGEIGEGEFSGKGGLLRISFSGESTSLSPT